MSATLCKQPCPERKAPLQTLEKAGLLFGVGGLVCEGGSGRPSPPVMQVWRRHACSSVSAADNFVKAVVLVVVVEQPVAVIRVSKKSCPLAQIRSWEESNQGQLHREENKINLRSNVIQQTLLRAINLNQAGAFNCRSRAIKLARTFKEI